VTDADCPSQADEISEQLQQMGNFKVFAAPGTAGAAESGVPVAEGGLRSGY
jgi:hypothetical protein